MNDRNNKTALVQWLNVADLCSVIPSHSTNVFNGLTASDENKCVKGLIARSSSSLEVNINQLERHLFPSKHVQDYNFSLKSN